MHKFHSLGVANGKAHIEIRILGFAFKIDGDLLICTKANFVISSS